jgi:sigma-B regulation protein RsbU (phosphoserine phosphatase)
MVRCRAWSLFLVDPATHDLVFEMFGGSKVEGLKGLRVRAGNGIIGWVSSHGKPVMVGDAQADRRFLPEVDDATRLKSHSVLCVPILSKGKTVAVLEMLGASFTRNDLQLLTRLTHQATIAL